MRTEEASSTVLHRLIQEQLRYGNPTDARTLLAIQQQALRSTVSRGAGSPRSSSDSLTQEERQEPQGQEHHLDFQHTEIYPPYHHEQLPTYEQAKANSQLVASQWCQDRRIYPEDDLKPSHGRSLSERLMQLSLLHKDVNVESLSMSSSCSYPQIAGYQFRQHHLGFRSHTHTSDQTHESDAFYQKPPPPFHSQHTRIVPPEAPHVFCSAPPAGREVSPQMDLLMKENERLKQELEGHAEKALRIQKLEQEIQRISEAYDTLIQGCVKRETLEQTLRSKLMVENKRLQDINTDLRESLESSSIQAEKDVKTADYNEQVIAKLRMQSEEQKLQCARMEREVQLLREERSAAQERSRQLQAELNRKSAYVERVERLQGALAQLQATCEKREGLEHRLRTRLESELRTLRNRQRQTQTCPGISAPSANVSTLLERLREREERILALEADMTRWEQKYLEEKTMMEFAMDTAATAAAQRDTNIINNRSPCLSSTTSCSEELPRAEIQSQEMENRIQALYGQIREKDAMINVLQYRLQQEQEKGEADEDASSNCASHSDSSSSNDKGKCNTEKTGIMARFSPFADAVCKTRGRAQTTTHTPPASEQLSSSQEISKQKAANPFEGLDSVEAEAVEIFI
ncbi:angiomotin-like protein 2b [Tachysurus vachellii]|uniref:angiomotin-like protein 2b n=1 Tax=Tachysurus vachellii TaxID=175792 RepID=UPI00296AE9BC|nr:angiomotin-like protein 2b [Tachysurus vachellii]